MKVQDSLNQLACPTGHDSNALRIELLYRFIYEHGLNYKNY